MVKLKVLMSNPEIIREAEKFKIHYFESDKEFLFERLADSETKLFGPNVA
jgi:hypothetical protein